MRKFILKCHLALGDIVLLTAAVRDLHRSFPGLYLTDVKTTFSELWEHNPLLTSLHPYSSDVRLIECDYPLVHRSNEAACHAIHGFIHHLNDYLGLRILPSEFKGDIHLSATDRRSRSIITKRTGREAPYWLVAAGGRYDNTIKWWDTKRYQEVVDRFRGRVQFVQVGDAAHYHPKLDGVIDLRGQTGVRDLVRLVYRAQGVLCGVTGLMHLAAAVPTPRGRLANRPCVVVAGGRESPHWEAYPGHQFIHNVGALPCCAKGGCWRSRIVPLGDGDERDRREHLCTDVRNGLPRCMDLIGGGEVAKRIESYFEAGAIRYLTNPQAAALDRAVEKDRKHPSINPTLSFGMAPDEANRFISRMAPYPGVFEGRGIVICGGGVKMFTNAWVCIRLLRHLGCSLPIELWHLGSTEFDGAMAKLVEPYGVRCVDASREVRRHPARLSCGWALKPYALLWSRFAEVLLLDADNVPVADPEYLFETRPYRRAGAVLWPDTGQLDRGRGAWRAFEVPYRREPEVESGQVLMDKGRSWRALSLCLWYNEHAEFYYQQVYGDKETFHLAFRRLRAPYAMPERGVRCFGGTMFQHDFAGRVVFQHRNRDKWNLFGTNRRIPGFKHERFCFRFLDELRRTWDAKIASAPRPKPLVVNSGRRRRAPRIAACMGSSSDRRRVRERTLQRLRQTDWGEEPCHVEIDPTRFPSGEDRREHTVWLALRRALEDKPDYVLYLEDDLEFNARLRGNLLAWPPVRSRRAVAATLYNPGLVEVAWDLHADARLVAPERLFGAAALVVDADFVRRLLDRWFEAPPSLDAKIGALTAREGRVIHAHNPSLVQRPERRDSWQGACHEAEDYRASWVSARCRGA